MLELYMPVQIDLYYQKVVVLPLFVTIPFSRSQKMTQMGSREIVYPTANLP